MQIKILVFGSLTDITNTSDLTVTGINDTDALLIELHRRYPSLAAAKFLMALNKQTVTTNTSITDGSTIALLPPFSGG